MKKTTMVALLATLALGVNASAGSTDSSMNSVGSVIGKNGSANSASEFLTKRMAKSADASGSTFLKDMSEGAYGISGNASEFSYNKSTNVMTIVVESANDRIIQPVSGVSADVNAWFFDGSVGNASTSVAGSASAQSAGNVSGDYVESGKSGASAVSDSVSNAASVVVELSTDGVMVSINGVKNVYGWSTGPVSAASQAPFYALSGNKEKGNVSEASKLASAAPSKIVKAIWDVTSDVAKSSVNLFENSAQNTSQISLNQDISDRTDSVITASVMTIYEGSVGSTYLVLSKEGASAAADDLDSKNGLKSANSAKSSEVIAMIPLNLSEGASTQSVLSTAVLSGTAAQVFSDGE